MKNLLLLEDLILPTEDSIPKVINFFQILEIILVFNIITFVEMIRYMICYNPEDVNQFQRHTGIYLIMTTWSWLTYYQHKYALLIRTFKQS